MGAIPGVILLDETVVGVALPDIQLELRMSEIASHWVVNIYMLLLAGLALLPTVAVQPFAAPLAGHVSDRFGARGPSLGASYSCWWGSPGLGLQAPGTTTRVSGSFPRERRVRAARIDRRVVFHRGCAAS